MLTTTFLLGSCSLAYCRKPYPLGLSKQVNVIPNVIITASSNLNFRPSHGTLRDPEYWCGKKNPNQSMSVDLRKLVTISGIATQGGGPGKTIEYEIRYGYNGTVWYGYPDNTRSLVSSNCVCFTLLFVSLWQIYCCRLVSCNCNHSH